MNLISNNFLILFFLLFAVGCRIGNWENTYNIVVTDHYAMDTVRFDTNHLKEWGDVFYESVPEPIYKATPKFPDTAIAYKINGTVWVKAFIDSTGRVLYATIIKSDDAMEI